MEHRDIQQTASAESDSGISATASRILNHRFTGHAGLSIRVHPCASVVKSFSNHRYTRMHTDKNRRACRGLAVFLHPIHPCIKSIFFNRDEGDKSRMRVGPALAQGILAFCGGKASVGR
jgi:hypothetical protein